jgi:hypothetical protein
VATPKQIARAAYKVASKAAGEQATRLAPTAKQSSLFFKHVVPAAVKPLHALWHEILGFVFLVFAIWGGWKLYRSPGALPPVQFLIVLIFIGVIAAYGVSSILKSRRINRKS